ncbi:BNR repeat-containing protein [Algibacillus agarilyticus]|uniref:BNR repeat-containing protein n=1 Tax=Algibacillus agarilyticus TaxID=2234133 RepID=UPI000DD05548|nr:BNR repeat-containing protein [Algibacillus agarilyticus]
MSLFKSPLLSSQKIYLFLTLLFTAVFAVSADNQTNDKQLLKTEAIDHVWSGHRIKPFLLTRGKHQFVAYFDANRQMTVAYRTINDKWRYYKVDSWLGWDSHNYVTMELDKAGHLHVMGNMHADPLEYFRTSEPYNVRSLKRIPTLVNRDVEQRMTYPIFLLNKNNDLIVKYRNGGSGNGNEMYNIYDTKSQSWSKLHNQQFLDGQGEMSGYFEGPTLGKDGYFHLIWVWRNTPNAATNHSLSYARSVDLLNWQDSNGNKIELPLTLAKTEIVDPVPAFGGMINGNVKLGFDSNNQPIITYHKYDAAGQTQMFLARKSGRNWVSSQISDWKNFRWDFSGHGSLGRFAVRPYSPVALGNNKIGVTVRKHDDIMQFIVDENTLSTLKVVPSSLYPAIIDNSAKHANLHMFEDKRFTLENQVFKGVGDLSPEGHSYYLSWFSQPGNRDNAHAKISPASVMLLHEVF